MIAVLQDALGGMGYAVAVYEHEETLLQRGDVRSPGCVVSILHAADEQSLNLPRRLFEHPSPLKVVMLAERPQVRDVVNAMRSGAVYVVEWPFDSVRLRQAIEIARAGSFQDRDRVVRCLAAQQKLSRLTAHEREVASLMLSEISSKNVANRLNVSVRTVESRRKAIFDKLETRSLAAIYVTIHEANATSWAQSPADPDGTSARIRNWRDNSVLTEPFGDCDAFGELRVGDDSMNRIGHVDRTETVRSAAQYKDGSRVPLIADGNGRSLVAVIGQHKAT